MAESQTNGSGAQSNADFYAGYSRFEIELEFVQSLSNPFYLQFLADQKYFEDEAFVAYLDYLQYFQESKYVRYLQYPGPTLRALELLQQEQFRKNIVSNEVRDQMIHAGKEAATSMFNKPQSDARNEAP